MKRVLLAVPIFVFLLSVSFAEGQKRQELCKKYSGTVDPRVYQCCIAGIDDYDQCMEFTSKTEAPAYNYATSTQVYNFVMECYNSGEWARKPCWTSEPTSNAGRVWENLKSQRDNCRYSCKEFDTPCANACESKFAPQIREAQDADQKAYEDWKVAEAEKKQLSEDLEKLKKQIGEEKEQPEETPPDEALSSKFERLRKKAALTLPGKVFDSQNNPVSPERLKAGLDESLPEVHLGSRIRNLKEDQQFVQEIPEGLALRRMMVTPSQTISEAEVFLSIGSTPKLLKDKGIPEPEPRRYELRDYFSVTTKIEEKETHPFKEAVFDFFVPTITEYEKGKIGLLRYRDEEPEWVQLPVEKVNCDGKGCKYLGVSPGTSFFAIVYERSEEEQKEYKEPEKTGGTNWGIIVGGFLILAILIFVIIGIIAVIAVPAYLIYRAKKKR